MARGISIVLPKVGRSPQAAAAVRRRHAFGELIGNNDMHSGNLALFLSDAVRLAPAPSCNMLPILWASLASGEIVELP